jgi:stage II sporulation protein D
MRKLQSPYYYCHISLIVALAIFAAGCAGKQKRPLRAPVTPAAPYRPKPEAIVRPSELPKLQQPVIRIGLKTDAKSMNIAGNEALYYTDGGKVEAIRSSVVVSVSFVSDITPHYSVQLGSFSTMENARQAQSALRSRTSQPTFIYANSDLHLYQLRLGPYNGKERAQQAIEEVKTIGYPDAFYVTEDSAKGELPEVILRDELGRALHRSKNPFYFWSEEGAVRIDGVRYRGYASVFVNRTARLTAVNILNFEDYLKGVVPNEIGPASVATYEALKAQAVAARTYAYKNLKQFEAEGYDLCATPRCQVYSGMSSENAFTSKAVGETKGQIMTYAGQPINALYTSTCGGRTENAEFMFDGWNYPYLKSVECYPEETEGVHKSVQLRGIRRDWTVAWLSAKTGHSYTGSLSLPVTASEVQSEVQAILAFLGKKPCNDAPVPDPDWIGLGNYLVRQLCWGAKLDSLLNEKDYRYFLSHLAFSIAPSTDTHSFLFLFHEGILVPQDFYRFNPYSRVKRGEFLGAMYAILKHYHQVNSQEGQLREANGDGLQVVDDLGVHMYPFHNPIYLFQRVGESVSPSDQLVCSPGDSVEYYVENGQMEILVCELNQIGAATDRSSKLSFWHETVTPAELGQRVSKYMDVGEVLELQPISYGVSHRVYEMKIVGSRNSGTLKGIRVRWALGLKDNLFTIDRTFDSNGRVKQFLFTGRGWGHGVGMCQIGAIGYARQGMDYQKILTHYYTGVQISSAY